MSGRHMNARPKRLTRKQKEALSAQGWVLMNKTTGHYVVFKN